MFGSVCDSTIENYTDYCNLEFFNILAALFITICLGLFIVYLHFNSKQRYADLFYLHNVRAIIFIILIFVNVLEICESILSKTPPKKQGFITSPLLAISKWFTLCSSIFIIAYHRYIEIYDKTGWLYISVINQAIALITKICLLIRITQQLDVFNLHAILLECNSFCLAALISADAYTIYKETNPKKGLKQVSSIGTNENIGYKHPHSTFFSKILFWWITPILWKGFLDPLELEDLGNLHEEDTCRSQYDQFLYVYQSFKTKNTYSLWLTYFKSNWKMFTYGGLLKLLGDLSALVGPLSITHIVNYIQLQNSAAISVLKPQLNWQNNVTESTDIVQDKNDGIIKNIQIYTVDWKTFMTNGWIMAIFVLFASLAQGSLSQASTHIVNMVGIRLRTSIQGLIYRKTLLISSSCFFNGNNNNNNNSEEIGFKRSAETGNNNIDNNKGAESASSPPLDNKKSSTTPIDSGTITNLMTEDALNVMSFFWIAHYVWAIPLKIGIVMYLLYQLLGVSAIIGATVCIITMIPLQFLIGKTMSSNAEKTSECTDERLKKINEVLLGIKIIKLNAWENVFKEKIQISRNNELKYLNRDSIYWALMTFLTHVSSVLITFVTLSVFISIEGTDNQNNVQFTASKVFAALALFNQLTVPLFIFPITVPIIIAAIVSTRRLEQFLAEQEVQREFEGIRNMARILCRSDASLDIYEIGCSNNKDVSMKIEPEDISQTISCNEDSSVSSSMVNNSQPTTPITETINNLSTIASIPFTFNNNNNNNNIQFSTISDPMNSVATATAMLQQQVNKIPLLDNNNSVKNTRIKLKKNNQISISTKLERIRTKQKSLSREYSQQPIAPELIVCIRNGIFTWDRTPHTDLYLTINKLDIPKGKLTIIVGRSGSGKTSLLAALLKEMQITSGYIVWNKYSTIAYVPQVPWLLNATIRDNIIFGESFRPKRYEKVLEVCSLKPDIELMPGGDMTEIGERGINLSGGQRQRIAIARALYSSANVVIMDDPLSSLDNEVAKWIFENSIRKMLLRHKRSVIFVTQKTYLVLNCDYIIAMENNYVRAVGTYKDIESIDSNLIREWQSIIAKENAKDMLLSPGRTARERWKLFKNVSRIGLRINTTQDDEPLTSSTSLFVPHGKKRGSVFGSRHLTYDMPLPIDECNTDEVVFRRRFSKRNRKCNSLELNGLRKDGGTRANSLIVDGNRVERSPVVRNVSSPITLQCTSNSGNISRISDNSLDANKNSGFREFLHRMSSRRSNSTTHSRIHKTISDSNSIKSIAEEHHNPVKRLISDASKYSEEMEDDISINFNEEISDRLIYDEERKYGKIPARIYRLYLKSCGVYIVLLFCVGAFGWQALRIYTDVWLREWTDINSNSNNENIDIMYYFKVYAILSGICLLFSVISTPAGQFAGVQARKHLHEQLLNAIMQKSLYFFQITPFGRVMNRFSNDMSVIDKKIAPTSQRLLQFILLCLCSVLINMAITPWFILLTIPICCIYYAIQRFYRRSSRELQRIESITSAPIISHFTETIQGVTTIRAYNQESRFMEILFKRMEANNIAFIMLNTSNRWLGIALDYLGGVIVFVAIIAALITSHLYPDTTEPSLVGLAINYTLLIPIYLNWVVKLLSDMEMYTGAVERIQYFIETTAVDDITTTTATTTTATTTTGNGSLLHVQNYDKEKCQPVPISWPHKGDITFENVTIRYENQKQNVITRLNLKIPAGQRIGICGRTGSGKSTLAMSLFRVTELIEGSIFIDDVDISTIHTDELRSRLSIIPQEVVLFSGTIRENLDPRSHYTDLELWNCLETAQLKDNITVLPFGLDTEMVENGCILSAGQKQLFCLARSVLRGSVCLVLDEATSSLDSVTEKSLLDAANKAFQGRTVITIAHRLTTLLEYNRIIVLENGQIVEDGEPKELRTKSGGKFLNMLNASMQPTTTGMTTGTTTTTTTTT